MKEKAILSTEFCRKGMCTQCHGEQGQTVSGTLIYGQESGFYSPPMGRNVCPISLSVWWNQTSHLIGQVHMPHPINNLGLEVASSFPDVLL